MEAKLKHLEFIQGVISRMSTSSFLFKGWAITLAASLSAFGAVKTKAVLLGIAALSIVLFWGLDGYYLWLERSFIKLHDLVAATPPERIDFSMKIDKRNSACVWFKTCWRPHLAVFYGTTIIIEVVGTLLVRSK
jgi:hypothetical protein